MCLRSSFANSDRIGVVLEYVSPAGEMGFPGTLDTHATYTLTKANALQIDYRATTDAPTVVNFTNHSYLRRRQRDHLQPQIADQR